MEQARACARLLAALPDSAGASVSKIHLTFAQAWGFLALSPDVGDGVTRATGQAGGTGGTSAGAPGLRTSGLRAPGVRQAPALAHFADQEAFQPDAAFFSVTDLAPLTAEDAASIAINRAADQWEALDLEFGLNRRKAGLATGGELALGSSEASKKRSSNRWVSGARFAKLPPGFDYKRPTNLAALRAAVRAQRGIPPEEDNAEISSMTLTTSAEDDNDDGMMVRAMNWEVYEQRLGDIFASVPILSDLDEIGNLTSSVLLDNQATSREVPAHGSASAPRHSIFTSTSSSSSSSCNSTVSRSSSSSSQGAERPHKLAVKALQQALDARSFGADPVNFLNAPGSDGARLVSSSGSSGIEAAADGGALATAEGRRLAAVTGAGSWHLARPVLTADLVFEVRFFARATSHRSAKVSKTTHDAGRGRSDGCGNGESSGEEDGDNDTYEGDVNGSDNDRVQGKKRSRSGRRDALAATEANEDILTEEHVQTLVVRGSTLLQDLLTAVHCANSGVSLPPSLSAAVEAAPGLALIGGEFFYLGGFDYENDTNNDYGSSGNSNNHSEFSANSDNNGVENEREAQQQRSETAPGVGSSSVSNFEAWLNAPIGSGNSNSSSSANSSTSGSSSRNESESSTSSSSSSSSDSSWCSSSSSARSSCSSSSSSSSSSQNEIRNGSKEIGETASPTTHAPASSILTSTVFKAVNKDIARHELPRSGMYGAIDILATQESSFRGVDVGRGGGAFSSASAPTSSARPAPPLMPRIKRRKMEVRKSSFIVFTFHLSMPSSFSACTLTIV